LALVHFGGRWENADPDSKAINVLIWRGRYVAAAAGAGRGHQWRGGDSRANDAGGNPRLRRLRSGPDTDRQNFACYDINPMIAIAMLHLVALVLGEATDVNGAIERFC
jgi:hypothetical protein